jgi:hypothetical protein
VILASQTEPQQYHRRARGPGEPDDFAEIEVKWIFYG